MEPFELIQPAPGVSSAPSLLGRLRARLSFKPLTYGYANARVHGLYSRFLTHDQLRALMAAPTADAMVELLERTAYKEDLVALSLSFKGDDLMELAVSRHFARFARQLLAFSPPGALATMRALLSRWDAHNLKVVLLARRQKKPFDPVIPYLVMGGSYDEARLRLFHAAASPDEVLHLLRSGESSQAISSVLERDPRLAERVRKLVLGMDKAESLQPLLDEFDRITYLVAMEAAGSSGEKDMDAVRVLLRSVADEKNLSTILRLSAAGARPSEARRYLVAGSHFPDSKWAELAEGGPDSPALRAVCRRLGWSAALDAYAKDRSLARLEVALARLSVTRSVKALRSSQMSIGVLAGALLLKEQEMANIRKIIRGKSLRLPSEEIEKMLVSAHA